MAAVPDVRLPEAVDRQPDSRTRSTVPGVEGAKRSRSRSRESRSGMSTSTSEYRATCERQRSADRRGRRSPPRARRSPAARRTPRRTRCSRPARTPRRSKPAVAGVHHRRHRRRIVFAAVGFVRLRFRDRGQDDARADPRQAGARDRADDHPGGDPASVVGDPTVSTVFALAKTSDTQCIVNVTGQQWWWEYDYPVQDGGWRWDHRRRSSPAASWSSRPRPTCCCASPAAT